MNLLDKHIFRYFNNNCVIKYESQRVGLFEYKYVYNFLLIKSISDNINEIYYFDDLINDLHNIFNINENKIIECLIEWGKKQYPYFELNYYRKLKKPNWFDNVYRGLEIIPPGMIYGIDPCREMVNDDVKARLKERIENGEDYLGRNRDWLGKSFEMWIDESELPRYIIDNKEKYVAYFKS